MKIVYYEYYTYNRQYELIKSMLNPLYINIMLVSTCFNKVVFDSFFK